MQRVDDEYSMIMGVEVNRSQVRIKDVLEIDERSCGRMDLIVMSYYDDISLMPIFLQWNRIVDVSKQKIGDIIQVPEMNDIFEQINNHENKTLLNDFDDNSFVKIPGIVENDASKLSSKNNIITARKSEQTKAVPSLGIVSEAAEYLPERGRIVYK